MTNGNVSPSVESLYEQCRTPESDSIIEAPGLKETDASALAERLNAEKIVCKIVNAANIENDKALFKEIAREFQFPDYFGHNWDALLDSWSDMAWHPAAGYVCILFGSHELKSKSEYVHDTLIDVCRDVAERFAQDPHSSVYFKLVRA